MRRVHWITLVVGAILLASVLTYIFIPAVARGVTLLKCKAYVDKNAQAECVFELIEQKLLDKGISPALELFVQAHDMFPKRLDLDCHAGIHRVGDAAYYNLYLGDPEVGTYSYPEGTMICNRGFFHGIVEHLVQDRPDPAFISKVCNDFKNNPDPKVAIVGGTCFHAAGHGLFRSQTEKVPKNRYGQVGAFIDDPIAICESLPQTEELDRFNCTTGVESIFIQTSLFNEYGFADPNPWNSLGVCDQLRSGLHASCYFVRSLMVSELQVGYERTMDDCYFASDALFRSCISGTIVGIFVNGVTDETYAKTLALCADSRVKDHGGEAYCYARLAQQLGIEYLGDFTLNCATFPEKYREECLAV